MQRQTIWSHFFGSSVWSRKIDTASFLLRKKKDEFALDTYLSTHLSCRNVGIMLSLYCGLRIGEVCGLQWADIDFDNRFSFSQENGATLGQPQAK